MTSAPGKEPPLITISPEDALRVPPPNPLDWGKLVLTIQKIAELDRNGNLDKSKLSRGFDAMEQAAHYVIKFLYQQSAFSGERMGDLEPLMRLREGLTDIRRGWQPPIFSRAAQGPRQGPRKGMDSEMMKATAARTLSLLMAGKKDVDRAAQKVAAALRRRGAEAITGKTIKNWRETLEKGSGPGASDAALFAYKRPLPPEFGSIPADQAARLLRVLQEWPRGTD